MLGKWLNSFLRFSGLIFSLKQKIVQAKSWTRALPYAILLIAVELAFFLFSLPLYLAVSPKQLQEKGLIFPSRQNEPVPMHAFVVRRRISLATVLGAGGIYLAKVVLVGLISFYLLGAQSLLAATQDWDFSASGDYAYDAAKIEVTGGVAQLKAITNTVSSSTVNAGFNSDASVWTYADWLEPGQATANGTYQSSGGNPGGDVDISLTTTKKNKTIAGVWRQTFATTVASPTTATLSFNWKSLTYASPIAPVTYQLYAFIDTASGNPTLGQQVWASGEITATSSWTSVANIDIRSKVAAAGTYYVKIVAHATTPGTDNTYTYVSNFDNVTVNWSKTTVSYDSGSPAITPNASLTPAGVTSWNSFTETATKNGGQINYQLSSDDGATWKYWTGSSWAAATTSTNSNAASVINTNIATFSYAEGRITWKAYLTGNGTQQVILDNVAIGYTQNLPPGIQSLSASQNTASSDVHVDYSLQDGNSDPVSLANYEYSLTGAFAGEQLPMTPAVADPSHGGISGLSSSPTGVAHTFAWDAKTDLGNVTSTVYLRLRANDGITNSGYATSSLLHVDFAPPVVSNVTAVVASGTSDVHIGYSLSEDSTNNNTVELQASSDGGSTWTVPVASVSGDIGATVTSGGGKSIIWLAGTDYANQEQNSMMVRVRAKDQFLNQGAYVDSASFVLDNRAPVIATQANLLAQPLAGADHVLVGGSFTEGNPNTNDFYVNVDANGYGSAVPGDADTATPSNLSIPTGAALDGNDVISAVKIVHTDDYGHVTANENTSPNASYRYVKPYTPPGPMVGNPGEGSLDVTIQANPLETGGLEYAIFEESQSLYVQGDGTLGASPLWGAVDTVTVTGLSQPLSSYVFHVKSRNTSDASHAASSESDLSSGTSVEAQAPQVTINSVAQATDGTKTVTINYTGVDGLNAVNDLVTYEYSQDGTSWLTMTEKTGTGSDGIADLPFAATGHNLVFKWNAGLDLTNIEDSTVYVRLVSNNGTMDSNTAVSSAFTIDTAGPVVANVEAVQTPLTDSVVISYDLSDAAGADLAVSLSVSDNSGSTYSVSAPSVSGDAGAGVTAGLTRQIVWDIGTDLPNLEQSTMKVKIAAEDSYSNNGLPVESSVFSIDTKDPAVSNVSASQTPGSALVAVTYDLADGSASNVEFDVSSDGGATWAIATSTHTGNIGASQTAGSKTFQWNAGTDYPDQESATMRIRIRATDAFGHQALPQSSSDFSVNTKVLSISGITAEQGLGGTTVTIHYDLNKDATIRMDVSSDGGSTWDVATSTATGHVDAFVTKGNNKTISWNPGLDFNNRPVPQ